MGLLTSIVLGALGVGVAMANTNDYADNQAHTPLYADLSAEAERVAEMRRLQNQAQSLPRRPSDSLGVHEWVRLCAELGYWDNPTEPVEEFWKRVRTWDAQHESQTEASSPQPQSALASYQSVPVSGSSSREVPLLGVDPETAQ